VVGVEGELLPLPAAGAAAAAAAAVAVVAVVAVLVLALDMPATILKTTNRKKKDPFNFIVILQTQEKMAHNKKSRKRHSRRSNLATLKKFASDKFMFYISFFVK
jgi:hypothetical protein